MLSEAACNNPTWRALAWMGVALQAMALVWVIWSESLGGTWTIALFLAFSAGFLLLQDRLPSLISLIVVVAALVNAGGWAWSWYQDFIWFDEFIHTFSSFALMAAAGYFAWSLGWIEAAPGSGRFIVWFAAIGLGMGILWEIAESFFIDLPFWDTIFDLVLDTIGAALAGWFVGQIVAEETGTARA